MLTDPIAQNRLAWEERARIHAEARLERLVAEVKDPHSLLLDFALAELLDVAGVSGSRVLHPCCNNGIELVGALRRGAATGVGVDFAEGNLAQARRLAEAAGAAQALRFVEADVNALPDDLGRFDLALVTVGTFGWQPRLDALLSGLARHLAPGGRLAVHEMHPVLDLFDDTAGPRMVRDYFDPGPIVEQGDADYVDRAARVQTPARWFHHSLGEVVSACLRAGLTLTHFQERPEDISAVYPSLAACPTRPPMSYTLVARRDQVR